MAGADLGPIEAAETLFRRPQAAYSRSARAETAVLPPMKEGCSGLASLARRAGARVRVNPAVEEASGERTSGAIPTVAFPEPSWPEPEISDALCTDETRRAEAEHTLRADDEMIEEAHVQFGSQSRESPGEVCVLPARP